jgi:hypothetical protein
VSTVHAFEEGAQGRQAIELCLLSARSRRKTAPDIIVCHSGFNFVDATSPLEGARRFARLRRDSRDAHFFLVWFR